MGILGVLRHNRELKLTHIMYETNVNCCVLKKYLGFLMKQGLVEERTVGRQRMVYSITQRGITVLKYFRELEQVLPILDEDYDLKLGPIQPETLGNLTV